MPHIFGTTSGSSVAAGTLTGKGIMTGTSSGTTLGEAILGGIFPMTGEVLTETKAGIQDRTMVDLESPITTLVEYESTF